MSRPRMAAAPTSPQEATTLGAKPAANSATPATRAHHGQSRGAAWTASSREHAASAGRPSSTSPSTSFKPTSWSKRKTPGVAWTTETRSVSPDETSVMMTLSGSTTVSTATPYARATRAT